MKRAFLLLMSIAAMMSSIRAQTMTSNLIIRNGNTYVTGGQIMKPGVQADNDYARFLEGRCPAAYVQFEQGRRTAVAGWVLMGIGLGCDIGSYVWALLDLGYTAGSSAVGYIGLGCELACIPTLIVGYTKMHHSADTYNAMMYQRPVSYWSINADENGIGLAYHF